MSVPKQCYGLTAFDSRISKCPPNPDAIRSIVFTKDSMAVVNGAATEITVSLSNLFIPVDNAARTSFSIPGKTPQVPYDIYKLDLAGLDQDEKVKFLALLPVYGATSTAVSLNVSGCSTSPGSTAQYVEWAFINDIETGPLYDEPVIGPSSSNFISFDTSSINKLEFSWGSYLNATGGTGSIWIASDGGLMKWNGTDMKLWNTLNSNSPSDYIKTLTVDSANTVWVGSNQGISRFNESSEFNLQWNTANSPLLSDTVNCLKLFSVEKIAIGTDLGLSLFDFGGLTWSNFTVYDTPELSFNNITALCTDSTFLFVGTTGGVFVYDFSLNIWESSPLDSSISGWVAPSTVTSMDAYGGNLYVGTPNGLVIVPYVGGSATTILSGPVSNDYRSIRIVKYGADYKLYAGHDDGISVYDIETDTWGPSVDSNDYPYLSSGINDVLPDYLSGSTTESTMFLGAGGTSGMARIHVTGTIADSFSLVPESNKNANLLFSFPLNPSSILYPSNQSFYFIFSKEMDTTSFENFSSLSLGLTGAGGSIAGSWIWSDDNRVATFAPTLELGKATGYNFTVLNGATATDGSYLKEKMSTSFYTEDIVPINGWNSIGKMLIHTGTENNYTQGLYLRNPQSTGVNFMTLIGR